ncbi:hypothetical protein GCM10020358_40750 [Amorphoplanes nipponensis]|uniref:Uncharacterized protein n=1 Tax=Actinoplanes nipponensis TaxID=135950 RepID=A0A919JDH5_9ACTN|nr:DUF6059 family protein [Actinoplanes nipponensis]GIE47380.1 hypothetical protein Ani05nite_09140 [Actinoplanes nipponensis]
METAQGSGPARDPWWRRALWRAVAALALSAPTNMLYRGLDDPAAGANPPGPPAGRPGHPERAAGHVPPSPAELALWRDLGWVPAARRRSG